MSKLKYGEFSFPTPTARPTVSGYARGGSTSSAPKTKGQAKVAKVMGEFKRGDLHSGSAKGPIVKSPKQAMAIALSEKKAAGYKDGGDAKKGEKSAKLVGMKREPEAIVKKEIALLKKAGAPAKIIKHEERELAMKKGGKPKYQQGGMYSGDDDYDEKGFRRLSHEEAVKVSKHPKYDPKRSANAQYDDLYDQKGYRRLTPEEANKVSKHPKYDPNRSANAQYDELFAEKRKSGGKVGYADGGDVDGRNLTPTEKAVGRANYKLEKHKKYKSDKYPEGRDNVVSRESPFDRKTVDMPGDFQGNTMKTPLGDRIIKSGDKYDPMFRFKKFSEDAGEMIKEKQAGRYYKKGGKACYADGGQVNEMVKENVRAKNVKPVKPRAPMTDRERQMMEQARGEKMDRQMRDAERQHYERERAENEADRKAMSDALMYIPRKIGEGAKSAYDAVMGKKKGGAVHSDVAMDKKMIKKAVHKHEASMHPGKPMTKLKKGGVPTFNRNPKC